MEQNISAIKNWLGTGSINIFGLPFSGKDTVGIRLAEDLGAKFLSSGLILRHAAEQDPELAKEMKNGFLADTNKFMDNILPYLKRQHLEGFPLVLSSVGRWEGEEYSVIEAAENANHPIKAVVLLNISEAEAKKRWGVAKTLADRGDREDDKESAALDQRMNEFIEKTMPVIETYQKRGLLVSVPAMADRETVYKKVIEELTVKAHQIEREII